MSKNYSPTELKALLRELDKRSGLIEGDAKASPSINLRQNERAHKFMSSLHEKQLAFANDPAKRKAALCTRRAGKTTVSSFMICKAALEYEHCLIPYITTTRENAQQTMWEELKALNRRWGFGIEFNETRLIATFPNGSRVWLLGASKKDDIERLRGPKYPLVVLDEAASFGPHVEELILAIVAPATRDYLGTIIMIGTPGMLPAGLFYEVTTGKRDNWSVHKWSLADNPFLPAEARDLELIRRDDGLAEEDPRYRREYLGEWVIEQGHLVYKFKYDRNVYAALPTLNDAVEEEWQFNLGVDLGYDDDTAFVVGAYSYYRNEFYVIECYKEPKMDISSVAAKIKEYESKYLFNRKVIDSGALGKMIVAELTARHGLSLDPAEKKDKLSFIEHMNSDLLLGRIQVPAGCPIIDEWLTLPWREDKREEHPAYANHLSDACLYAWRDAKHYMGEIPRGETRTPEQIKEDEYEMLMSRRGKRNAYAALGNDDISQMDKEWWSV